MTAVSETRARDACFRAGMNDFIAKPFDIHVFRSVLCRWCELPNLATPEAKPEGALAQSPLLDGELDEGRLFQLMQSIPPETLLDLATRFLREAATRENAIRAATDRGDSDVVRQQAHALKSAAALFGLRRLAEAAAAVEMLAASGAGVRGPAERLFVTAASAYAMFRSRLCL